jgi:hypothetical protein
MADDTPDKNLSADKSTVASVASNAKETQKLLRLLVDQIIKLFRDKDLPLEIKLWLAPLLFMVPLYSLVLVIFVGDITYCTIVRSRDPLFVYYLIFLGTTGPLTLIILLAYSLVASRFENSRTLESQLQSVTAVRRPRRRSPR